MQERVSVVQLKEPPPPRLPRQLTESLTLFDLDEVRTAWGTVARTNGRYKARDTYTQDTGAYMRTDTKHKQS